MSEFTSKVALVTGAASGIGRTSAQFYAREGAKVTVSDVNEPGGQETARLIHAAGGETIFARADVSRPADCEALVRKTVETFGRLDFACNNAGIGGELNPTASYSIEGWQNVIAINLSGVFYCRSSSHRLFRAARGSGRTGDLAEFPASLLRYRR